MTEATTKKTATAKAKPRTLSLVLDGGNGAIKAVLLENNKILETVVIPSLLRFTNECDYVRGGAAIEGIGYILGWDCESRQSALVIGNESDGKLKYLSQILGGAVSALVHHFSVGSILNVYILTLNLSQKERIGKAVEDLANLSVDGVALKLKPRLVNILPEGFGCSSFAAKSFSESTEIVVFDIGSGTANLSSYYVGNPDSAPRRQSFQFQPSGVRVLEEFLADELRSGSSNGRVDLKLMKQALVSNTYRLLTSFDGQDITKEVQTAIDNWLSTAEMKSLLNQVVFLLQTGTPVICCGGAWKIQLIKEAVELLVLANAPAERWLVPTNSHILGALGLAQVIIDSKDN